MLYIKRDKNGQITGLSNRNSKDAELLVDLQQKDVQEYLANAGISLNDAVNESLSSSDQALVRVIEDLIAVLLQKGVITLTDLPQEALDKLSMRSQLRQQRESLKNLMADEDDALPL